MVHVPGFARTHLCIQWAVVRVYRTGFPHSEIPGSSPACGFPRLIAACHVLHRLLLPRHPPCALSSLTIKFTQHTRFTAVCSKLYQSLFLPLIASLTLPLVEITSRRVHEFGTRSTKVLINLYSPCLYLFTQCYSVVKHRSCSIQSTRVLRRCGQAFCPRFSLKLIACDSTSNSPPVLAGSGNLVELTGIEPVTPCLQSRCSPS